MLIKHSWYYAIALGMPGLINLVGLFVYTRILSPVYYGQYALVIAGVGLFNCLIFQWLRLGVLRYYQHYQEEKPKFISTVFLGYLTCTITSLMIMLLGLLVITDSRLKYFILIATALTCTQAFFDLNQELARIQLLPKRYGCFTTTKAILSFGIGSGLAYLGWGATGLLIGLLSGMILPNIWSIGREWKIARLSQVDFIILRKLLVYGLPLTANFALGFIVRSSDRFFLGWFLDSEATGLYSVGYDLANQTIGLLLMIINLAAYPLAVRALEKGGKSSADAQLKENGSILMALAIPATAGFSLLSANIAEVMLGKSYCGDAAILMPVIAVAALIAGIKSYYFDLSFQLGQNTVKQVWAIFIAAVVNILLNFWWIPTFGIMGAAYSTLVAYFVGLCLSIYIGRKVYVIPIPFKGVHKVIIATFGMVIMLLPLKNMHGNLALVGQVTTGALAFCLIICLLDYNGIRKHMIYNLNRIVK